MTAKKQAPAFLRESGFYRTSNLNFAAYLMASGRLEFVKAERRINDNRSDFYFNDPKNEGTVFAAEYSQYDLKVGARTLFDCRSQLVSEALREGGQQ